MHTEEVYNWYALPNVITMIRYRRIKWARRVARIIRVRNACKIIV